MKRFTPNDANGNPVEWHGDTAIAKHPSGKFLLLKWNNHYHNWVRENKEIGGAVSLSLRTVIEDNLGGGPKLMTLTKAREEAEEKVY